jgi:GTP cyclohydrolase I/GTP cyclohydrolase-4
MNRPLETAATTVSRRDVQAGQPTVNVMLSRVGVTNVEKIIRIATPEGPQLFYAQLDCFVDLRAAQKGVHMSRFEEIVNEAIDEVILRESFKAEVLAGHIAELVRERQGGARAEVRLRARYPEHKPAPESGIPTQEIYTMLGTAAANGSGTRRIIGVQAQGMTACPCAQEMVADNSRQRLAADGFTEGEIERVLRAVPVATHNQRGVATLQVGCPMGTGDGIDAGLLLHIAESSMSSEIYELMKRDDEVSVVEKAHRRPRFVEDCVREMIAGTTRALHGELPDDAFVSASQENLETIHQHNVVAERSGLLSELAAEVDSGGEQTARHIGRHAWLDRRY